MEDVVGQQKAIFSTRLAKKSTPTFIQASKFNNISISVALVHPTIKLILDA